MRGGPIADRVPSIHGPRPICTPGPEQTTIHGRLATSEVGYDTWLAEHEPPVEPER
jgi:hypothetical protein